jgi:hypothetical protein
VSEGTVPRWPAGLEFSTDRATASSTDGCVAAPPAPPDVSAPSALSAATGGQHVPSAPPPIPRLGMGVCIGVALLGLRCADTGPTRAPRAGLHPRAAAQRDLIRLRRGPGDSPSAVPIGLALAH